MVKSISYSDKIVLYWDLPEFYEAGSLFVISSGNAKIGETFDFHYEIRSLSPECEYSFSVCAQSGDIEHAIGTVTASTLPVPQTLDISLPPYNATGDGHTVNTCAIQKAIDDCTAGGRVYVPEGVFFTGSLRLHSDMELYLAKGAVLRGTTDVHDYEPKIKSRFEGIEMMCYSALINIGELDRSRGINCRNVRICGEGTVCGGGIELAENVIKREKVLLKDYIESLGDKINECENSNTIPGRARPRLINVSCSENVLVSGITVMNGASWNVHMIYSSNVITHGCSFKSSGVWNGDGWDPDSSANCTIFGCDFYTGDDAVAVKSGKNPEGNIINRPCEHICIFDCVSHSGHGITIGSEISGGINDVHIWNCDMSVAARGIEIKATRKRGGFVKNVRVSHCVSPRVLMHTVSYNDDGAAAPSVPVFSDCSFENMSLTGEFYEKDGRREVCNAIELCGFDEPDHYIQNISFKNITLPCPLEQTVSIKNCCDISFENVALL